MRCMGSRRKTLVGLGAAASAFGAAAMMSAAAAPAARADAFTDIINAVDVDLAAGQTAFTTAFTDFGSNLVPNGLAEFFSGVNDDLIAAPDSVFIGGVEALTGEPVVGAGPLPVTLPANFATAVTDDQTLLLVAQGLFADAATAFSSGEFGTAATDSAGGSALSFDIPVELLILGAVNQFTA